MSGSPDSLVLRFMPQVDAKRNRVIDDLGDIKVRVSERRNGHLGSRKRTVARAVSEAPSSAPRCRLLTTAPPEPLPLRHGSRRHRGDRTLPHYGGITWTGYSSAC
jgi:hypothetical protein